MVNFSLIPSLLSRSNELCKQQELVDHAYIYSFLNFLFGTSANDVFQSLIQNCLGKVCT